MDFRAVEIINSNKLPEVDFETCSKVGGQKTPVATKIYIYICLLSSTGKLECKHILLVSCKAERSAKYEMVPLLSRSVMIQVGVVDRYSSSADEAKVFDPVFSISKSS